MKVKVRVISQKGTCHANHKVGDEIIISENKIQGNICIHALYSMLPKAFAMIYDVDFPWLKEGQLPNHACPDAKNPVVFEFEKIK